MKTFVHDSPEPHRSQLQTLLYPLFVNIYLELLQNAQTAAGGYNKGVAILNIINNNYHNIFLSIAPSQQHSTHVAVQYNSNKKVLKLNLRLNININKMSDKS